MPTEDNSKSTEDFTLEERILVLETHVKHVEKELALILKEYNSIPPAKTYQSPLPGLFTII